MAGCFQEKPPIMPRVYLHNYLDKSPEQSTEATLTTAQGKKLEYAKAYAKMFEEADKTDEDQVARTTSAKHIFCEQPDAN